jgi:hypothetical protein
MCKKISLKHSNFKTKTLSTQKGEKTTMHHDVFWSRMLRAVNSRSAGIVSYWNLLVMISSNDPQCRRTAGQWKQVFTPHFKEMQCMDLKITSNLRMKLTDSFLKKNIFF